MNNKDIILFSDLEGTLVKENGEFDEENFYKFGQELQNLADATKSNVNIVIVSPMGPTYMTKLLDQMDKSLSLLERRNLAKINTVKIIAAVADFEDIPMDFNTRIDRRIDELRGVRTRSGSFGADAKLNYISGYIKTQEEHSRENLANKAFYIYAGNGDNDVAAISFVNKLKNGLTITPANTVPKVEKIAQIKSNLSGVSGITDCIRQIRMAKIEKDNKSLDDKEDK